MRSVCQHKSVLKIRMGKEKKLSTVTHCVALRSTVADSCALMAGPIDSASVVGAGEADIVLLVRGDVGRRKMKRKKESEEMLRNEGRVMSSNDYRNQVKAFPHTN
jgi:microcompartment protein CcmK/EutM